MVDRRTATFQDRLGQALVEGGFITADQLAQARDIAQANNKRLTDVLQEKKLISREVLTTALSFQLKVPIVNLKQVNIDPKVLELIPEEFAREHEVIPIALDPGGALRVAGNSYVREEKRLYDLFVSTFGTPPVGNRVSPGGETRDER